MKKKFTIFVLCVLLLPPIKVFAASPVPTPYVTKMTGPYVVNKNNRTELKIYNFDLDSAKKYEALSGKIERTDTITGIYDEHIYHYVADATGVYEFSVSPVVVEYNPNAPSYVKQTPSEGCYDTIGAIYKRILSNYCKSLTSDDDNKRYYSSEKGRKGCSMSIYLECGEEVFFCMRGKDSLTGKYILRIEPNQDTTKAIESSNYSPIIWKPTAVICSDRPGGKAKLMTPKVAEMNMLGYTEEIIYFNKVAVAFKYELLDNELPLKYNHNDFTLDDLYTMLLSGNGALVFDIISTCFHYIPFDKISIPVAILVEGLTALIGEIIEYNIPRRSTAQKELCELCKVKQSCNLQGEYRTYASYGLYQKYYKIAGYPKLHHDIYVCKDYDTKGNVLLKGVQYYKGEWQGYTER